MASTGVKPPYRGSGLGTFIAQSNPIWATRSYGHGSALNRMQVYASGKQTLYREYHRAVKPMIKQSAVLHNVSSELDLILFLSICVGPDSP